MQQYLLIQKMADDLDREIQLLEFERQTSMDTIRDTLQTITSRLDSLYAMVGELKEDINILINRTAPKSSCVFCPVADNVDNHLTSRCHRYSSQSRHESVRVALMCSLSARRARCSGLHCYLQHLPWNPQHCFVFWSSRQEEQILATFMCWSYCTVIFSASPSSSVIVTATSSSPSASSSPLALPSTTSPPEISYLSTSSMQRHRSTPCSSNANDNQRRQASAQ